MKEEKYVWVYVDYREEKGGEIEFSTPENRGKRRDKTM